MLIELEKEKDNKVKLLGLYFLLEQKEDSMIYEFLHVYPHQALLNYTMHLFLTLSLISHNHCLQTRELIEDLKSASGLEQRRSKLGSDTKTLLRILCHRGDSEASQYVKKQFKIPKSGT